MTVEEPRRPPECKAELTRLDAEDISSSSSEDNSEFVAFRRRKQNKGSPLSSSKEDNKTGINHEEDLNSQNRVSEGEEQEEEEDVKEYAKQLSPITRSAVKCLMSTDKCLRTSRPPAVPFVFSGPKRSPLVQELKIQCEPGKSPFKLGGGAEYGQLLTVEAVLHPDIFDRLHVGDVLLSANRFFISSVFGAGNPLDIEFLHKDQIPAEISEIFFDKRWINLHVVIRDNALLHTCQYTTRPPRSKEISGQEYHFVTFQEFHSLCHRGFFLEWSENSDGYLYGTPKPPNLQSKEETNELSSSMVQSPSPVPSKTVGPLPPNWEIAYTELGEKYFIDHNSGTTQWTDPREQSNKRSSGVDLETTNGVINNGVVNKDEEVLPEGWERIEDETHGVFYADHINRKTQYERPEVENKNGYTSTGITTSAIIKHRQEPKHRPIPPEPLYPPPVYHSTTPTTTNHFDQPSPSAFHQQAMLRNRISPSVKRRSVQQHQFTTDPSQLKGELLTTHLYKGPKGFGFTLIGNDGGNAAPEFIQIKSILHGGSAHLDNVLHTGDILVYVDNECMLGASQDYACGLLRSVPPGDSVTLQVCRGYPLILEATNKIISLGNVYTPVQYGIRSPDQMEIIITKGPKGFGFTVTDSPQGQRVKSILYPDQCPNLFENDLILEVDGRNAIALSHSQLVQMLQDFPIGYQTRLLISRSSPKNRSRTPTAGFRFGEKSRATPLPILPRSKTPAPQTRPFRPQYYGGDSTVPRNYGSSRSNDIYEELNRVRLNSDPYSQQPHYGGPLATPNYVPLSALSGGRNSTTPFLFTGDPKFQLVTVNLIRKADGFGFRLVGGSEMGTPLQVGSLIKGGAAHQDGRLREGDEILEIDNQNVIDGRHDVAVQMIKNSAALGHVKLVIRRLKDTWTYGYNNYTSTFIDYANDQPSQMNTYDVHLVKNPNEDFGCTLVTIENRFIGRIIPGTPADRCGRLRAGDCVVMINGFTTNHMTHKQTIEYIKSCGNQVTFTIDPTILMPRYAVPPPLHNGTVAGPIEAEDAVYTSNNGTLTNGHNEHDSHLHSNGNIVVGAGLSYLNKDDKDYNLLTVELSRGPKNFGFSIRGGFEFGRMPLFILRIAEDGPAAHEGSLKVGDQLVEINGESTAGMTHERAISLIREQPTVRLVVKRNS